jgi:hypothetical protein
LLRTIRADGQEENKGKRASQKHPNTFQRERARPRLHVPWESQQRIKLSLIE